MISTRTCKPVVQRYFRIILLYTVVDVSLTFTITAAFLSHSICSNLIFYFFHSRIKMAPNSIHWFRKGLRLHDNPALREAVRGAGTVRCVYFLDPWFAGSSNVGVNRWR